MDQGDLAAILAYQIVTGGFRSESVIELDTAHVIPCFQTIHQNHVFLLKIEREASADNQYIITQATGQLIQTVHHFRFAVRETEQQMFLVLTKMFFQRIKITGRLVNIVLRANYANTTGGLAQQ